jgi:hypothetical protein
MLNKKAVEINFTTVFLYENYISCWWVDKNKCQLILKKEMGIVLKYNRNDKNNVVIYPLD